MKNFFVLLLSMTIGFYSMAQNQLCTAETLWKLGRVNLEDVSPDGSLVVYSVTYYNTTANKQIYI